MRYVIACTVVGMTLTSPLVLAADEAQAPPAPKQTSSPLCFKLTQVCLERRAPAADAPSLDLEVKPADLQHRVSQLEVNPPAEDIPVEVKDTPISDLPQIPGGPFAVFWALRHPTQAWRIFLPVQ